ncbi:EAL domain, c-di-GMP-specific phosphodiesterase class I (or its enzymatically inactive variant) [Pseudidiomarina planktonica]|uniref:EAL domain, c-di-GMP-specific phosphodiesterase class I (Or its enzymatically inactive variant) n=1 Tax=Pseudidiomarina planktonica TaxID=1323738 RepID=A0A1Y6G1C0_9GAMM|nr:EAL domain-containing protein [Pseudidiomarina planktonica]SMQ80377.1 EAL domain, c-di-GMP-specific phosphodiesterase class I (or its enzymatically inactive variant) [Pseudidiomarina planktonica]
MWPSKESLENISKFLRATEKYSSEVHLLIGLLSASLIAITFKLIAGAGGVPHVFEYGFVLLIVLSAFIHGPMIGGLAGLIVGMMLSPVVDTSVNTAIRGEDYFWPIRLIVLTMLGLGVGILKRLVLHLHDALHTAERRMTGTNLPNLTAAVEHIDKLIKVSDRTPDKQLNLVNLRLENIEKLRQELGRKATDEFLVMLADKFQKRLGADSYVTQTSSNELTGIHASESADAFEQMQKDINSMLLETVAIQGKERKLEAAAGLYGIGKAGQRNKSVEQLMQELTATTQRAIDNDQPLAAVIDSHSDDAEDIGAFSVKRQLQEALAKNEFVLHYQPRLNTANGYFTSLEVIPLWNHPRRGMISFAEAMPILEEASMVQYFSMWLVRHALHDAEAWFKKGYKFRISLNISLTDKLDAKVLAYILREVRAHTMASGLFSLEVSEAALVNADKKSMDYLTHIQHQGLCIIASDFGEGKATIQTLFRMPVDAVKFTKGLINKAGHHSDKKRELYSLIKMVRSKGLTTIAKGVQNREALLMLKQLGVDELQGPILSKALPKKDIPWARIR